MKKTLKIALGVLTASLATTAFASTTATDGVYVQLDAGHSSLKLKAEGATDTTKHFSPRFSLGYKDGDFRYALDYQMLSKNEETITERLNQHVETTKITNKLNSIGLSVLYDFHNESNFTPYVGLRVAQNKMKIDVSESDNAGANSKVSASKSKFGYGVVAGVDYNFTESFSTGLNVEYNKVGNFNFQNGTLKADQFGVNVGIRYKF